jgi:hypothetical protein
LNFCTKSTLWRHSHLLSLPGSVTLISTID